LKPRHLDDLISVRGRFHRSVNVVHDWTTSGADLSDYIVTPTARELADQVLTELSTPRGTRAWSVTGPYGSGKSALGLFLADILASPAPSHPESARLRDAHAQGRHPFIPVFAVAERQPLPVTLASALASAFKPVSPSLSRKFRRVAKGTAPAASLVGLLQDSADDAVKAGFGGVLLFLDEMGKFLEFAADNDLDLFLLQQIAELADRSSASPLLFVTVLHTGFADYLPFGEDVRRVEWQKVQGRFRDVPFHLPAEQLLGLVGHSMEKRWSESLAKRWRKSVDHMLAAEGVFTETARRLDLRELFYACYPFHPVAALLLWPLFRSKLAQNERSLFAFLTSFEPAGFREFLRNTAVEKTPATLFGTAELHDYVSTSLGIAAFRGDQARRWSLIEHALDRVPADAPAGAAEIVKSVGLITMYGTSVGLRASLPVLRTIVGKDADVVVSYLERHSILLYRRHSDAYALWEGSDIDLDAAFADAVQQVEGGDVAARVRRALDLRPLIARAHYIERGTLRLFEVDVVAADARAVVDALARPLQHDGRVLFVVGGSQKLAAELLDRTLQWTTAERHQLTVIGIPHASHGLEEALRELEAWIWVRDHVATLAGDPVARQEVRSRIAAARERFERIAGGVFGLPGHLFDPSLTTWIHSGERQETGSSQEFQRWLSQLCEKSYPAAPPLRNELINRASVSSATSAARRNLLEQLMAHEAEEWIGIVGTPPEASIYASMLLDSGIHSKREGAWAIGRPTDAEWQPAWDAITAFLEEQTKTKRSLSQLYSILGQPPYGMREAPISVLVSAALIAHQDEVALYEDGLFVADFRIEVLERLIRRPGTFAVQSLRLTGPQRSALRMLRRLISNAAQDGDGEIGEADLIPVVRSLILMMSQLNPYTRRTTRIVPREAVAVRNEMLRATDPQELLFRTLPGILGHQLDEVEGARRFAERLYECVGALRNTYAELLDDIGDQVRAAFALSGSDAEVWGALRAIAKPLQRYGTDRKLRLFVTEIVGDHRPGDWREVVARAVQGGTPPSHWGDRDVQDFRLQLQEIATECTRLSALAAEKEQSGGQQILRIDILGETTAEVKPVTIVLSADLDAEVGEIAERISALLAQTGPVHENGNIRTLRLAALARVAAGVFRGD
jgi:hypothetical protein